MDRAERRRRARAEQKAKRRANHPRHGYDPDAVRFQLLAEAAGLGIEDLVAMDDLDLDGLPGGSVELAKSVFDPSFSIETKLLDVVHLVANVCELWADFQPDPDDAEERMLHRCGLKAAVTQVPRRIEVVTVDRFSNASMLVANRVALIGEHTPTHR